MLDIELFSSHLADPRPTPNLCIQVGMLEEYERDCQKTNMAVMAILDIPGDVCMQRI